MDVRHPAIVDAIAPPAVTTDNVKDFDASNCARCIGESHSRSRALPRVSRASMIAVYRSRKVRTLRAPADTEPHK